MVWKQLPTSMNSGQYVELHGNEKNWPNLYFEYIATKRGSRKVKSQCKHMIFLFYISPRMSIQYHNCIPSL